MPKITERVEITPPGKLAREYAVGTLLRQVIEGGDVIGYFMRTDVEEGGYVGIVDLATGRSELTKIACFIPVTGPLTLENEYS